MPVNFFYTGLVPNNCYIILFAINVIVFIVRIIYLIIAAVYTLRDILLLLLYCLNNNPYIYALGYYIVNYCRRVGIGTIVLSTNKN